MFLTDPSSAFKKAFVYLKNFFLTARILTRLDPRHNF
jgi:hypothetical protein